MGIHWIRCCRCPLLYTQTQHSVCLKQVFIQEAREQALDTATPPRHNITPYLQHNVRDSPLAKPPFLIRLYPRIPPTVENRQVNCENPLQLVLHPQNHGRFEITPFPQTRFCPLLMLAQVVHDHVYTTSLQLSLGSSYTDFVPLSTKSALTTAGKETVPGSLQAWSWKHTSLQMATCVMILLQSHSRLFRSISLSIFSSVSLKKFSAKVKDRFCCHSL